MDAAPAYAELHCRSNFSFLTAASHPEELVARAAALGYRALALTDECSLAGVVRAHVAAEAHGLRLLIGSEVQIEDGPRLVLLAADRDGYGNLAELITRARRAAPKGQYRLRREDLDAGLPGCLALWLPATHPESEHGSWLQARFAGRCWLGVTLLSSGDDAAQLGRHTACARALGLGLVACGGVEMHCRGRRALHDTLAAIRLGQPLQAAGLALAANAERHLRSRQRLGRLYPPALLAETVAIAERCRFSLDQLRYEYPEELVPAGQDADTRLAQLTWRGAARRWPDGTPPRVGALIEHELALIAELGYAHYFLTVEDIVRHARTRGILCQGRGSAANSAVCYCLGITEVDPARMAMLFERFISRERNEPPDIDVDFEHERREEVLQYIYRRYGRERAALTATVIRYRGRSALRDVGKALGLESTLIERLAALGHWDTPPEAATLAAAGLDPDAPALVRLARLVGMLIGFPRHLSQHVGGMVIARGALCRLVPIENAAMPERTVIQWDKDDLDALGLLKIDCLALGMLSAIRRALALIGDGHGRPLPLAAIPAEDPAVYRMLQAADTVGVFQIESRAQMAMLPRLLPSCFYDLVIQVAIVRPGPIQGGMVHPYLRRRRGEEPVDYPGPAVREVLERTLGVPIFQEQVMQLAVIAAGFSPGEADRLRRSMAAWRRQGEIEPLRQRFVGGMLERGYDADLAERLFRQVEGFGEYGFPESHAASFALLVYVSAWLKCHHPAAFTAALLNSQPMGFYAPSQLVQDARRHGVEVRPVSIDNSHWDCTLEPDAAGSPALRLGLRLVRGLGRRTGEALTAARAAGPWRDLDDLVRRAGLDRGELDALRRADALRPLSGNRRTAAWQALALQPPTPLDCPLVQGPQPALPQATLGEELVSDYAATGLSLRPHPLSLLRAQLRRRGVRLASELRALHGGDHACTAGLVINRQRPGSAGGTVFLTLEDESGLSNVIVHAALAERSRAALLGARLLRVIGRLERDGGALQLVAHRLEDLSPWLGRLSTRSRDFR